MKSHLQKSILMTWVKVTQGHMDYISFKMHVALGTRGNWLGKRSWVSRAQLKNKNGKEVCLLQPLQHALSGAFFGS